MVKLNDNFRIEKSGRSWNLIEKYTTENKEKEIKTLEKVKYYGTLYQALQSFCDIVLDDTDLYDLSLQIKALMSDMKTLRSQIEDDFCIVRKESN